MQKVGGPPGIDFTNVLRAAFTRVGPKSAKMTVNSLVILRFLGSTHVKAARKTCW